VTNYTDKVHLGMGEIIVFLERSAGNGLKELGVEVDTPPSRMQEYRREAISDAIEWIRRQFRKREGKEND